jgi:transposase
MRLMEPYSEDLRLSIVAPLQSRMSKSAASRLFGVSRSSVKRYARIADRGASLAPRKGGGRPPKASRITERLLEADIRECPAATSISERCRFQLSATGKSLSLSTVKRLLKRIGFSIKNGLLWGRWSEMNG